jgi:TP901 family phage tail tape measure protein
MPVTVADLLVSLSGDPRGFNRAMSTVERRMGEVGKKMTQVGKSMTLGVSMPLAGIGTIAGKMAAGFESSMAKIHGLVGIQREQVEAWKADIMAMAPEVGKMAGELAEGMFFVTSAGARGQQALDTLRASAMGAAAGLGSTAVVADAATSAVNAYGKENLSAAQATAILVATVREGKASAEQIAPVLGNLLSVAARLGVSFDQVGGAIAQSTRLGTDASIAATNLSSIMSALMKPTKQADEVLAQYGLSAGELRRQIREKGLLTVLGDLERTFGDNEDALTALFRNIRAFRGVTQLIGGNLADTQRVMESLAGTTEQDLVDAFQAAADTADFKLHTAMANLNNAMILLGNEVLPLVVPKIQSAAESVDHTAKAFGRLSPGVQDTIISFGAFLVALGPMTWALGGTISGIQKVFGALSLLSAPAVGSAVATVGAMAAAFIATYKATGALARTLTPELVQGFADMMSPLETEVDMLMESMPLWDERLAQYEDLRKRLGATTDEWQVNTEWTRRNAEQLAENTEKLIQFARRQREAGSSVAKSNAPLRDKEYWLQRIQVVSEETEKKHAKLIATMSETWDVLSAEQVKTSLEKMRDEFERMVEAGLSQQHIADAMVGDLSELVGYAKEYGLTLTEGQLAFAEAVAKRGDPALLKQIEMLNTGPKYASLAAEQMVNVISSASGKIATTLAGGFGQGVQEGIRMADQWLGEYIAKSEYTMKLDVFPMVSYGDLNAAVSRMVHDELSGKHANTGGLTP